ncbi:MAG: undecaprenyldiphospho-muramoylpentapeptide beta-N-acetylglucosaminyltransferase [bacterium]
MRIIVSGGGTGGHISPVLAVIKELQLRDSSIEILYIGSTDGLESKIIPQTGINFRSIPCGKFRRYHHNQILNFVDPTTIFKNVKDMFKYLAGIQEAKKIIKEYDPDVIFTKGGYVSLPVGKAAISLDYPLVIHESDSVLGMSNRMLAKHADKVCVAYPLNAYKENHFDNLVYTGNPIRDDIKEGSRDRAIKEFDLDKNVPVIMIIGGSQGSYIINKLIADSWPKLLSKYQVIHVSGERDYDWLLYKSQKIDSTVKKNYHLYNFLSGDLKDAYSASDLVISRAGNNVIAELAALSKPTILIPLSTSANNHQIVNAQILSQAGAALLMFQEHLTPTKLIRQLELLFENKEELEALANHISSFAKNDAAKLVAEEISKVANDSRKEDEKNPK